MRRKIAHGLLWRPTFDADRLTTNMERSYEAMWEVRSATLNEENDKQENNEDGENRHLRSHKHVHGKTMNVGPSWKRYHIVVAPKIPEIADPTLDLMPRLNEWTNKVRYTFIVAHVFF